KAAPKKAEVSSDVAVRIAQARKLLQAGEGCQAQAQLDGVEEKAAGVLRPLAQFLCAAEKGTVNDSQLRQVSDAIQRRDYGTAMYNLLIARQGTHKTRADAIMRGLFELLGAENALVQAYQTQLS
ncbi:MAG: hypothetical protein GY943_33690, partial [Chloroflexi bacterium]|nr:hypothetical protein [Chloroflexota bacterium]